MEKTILNFILESSRQCPREKKNHSYCSLIPRDQSLLTAWAGWGEGEGEGEGEEELLGSHGFHSKGDYRRLTAIRGGP